MREIKFRIPVYRHSTGAFLRFYFVTLKQGTVSFTCPAVISNDEIHKDEEQFTGRRDKDGKEIYEGDIVDHEDSDFLRVVKWSSLLPAFTVERAGFRECVWYNEKYAKVIGNIHENPELLNNA